MMWQSSCDTLVGSHAVYTPGAVYFFLIKSLLHPFGNDNTLLTLADIVLHQSTQISPITHSQKTTHNNIKLVTRPLIRTNQISAITYRHAASNREIIIYDNRSFMVVAKATNTSGEHPEGQSTCTTNICYSCFQVSVCTDHVFRCK